MRVMNLLNIILKRHQSSIEHIDEHVKIVSEHIKKTEERVDMLSKLVKSMQRPNGDGRGI